MAAASFEHFGASHLGTLAAILSVGLGVALMARRLAPDRLQSVATGFAAVLVVYRTTATFWVGQIYHQTWIERLPLHICGVLFFICAFAMWKRHQFTFEVAYFWGLGGTLQALLTPELSVDHRDPGFWVYFFDHGVLIVALLFLTVALRMRPLPGGVWRALLATLVYAALLLPINVLLGTNFMYLLAKPRTASLLDHLGPWPWYILATVGAAGATYLVWYLPYWIFDRLRGPSPKAAPAA